MGFSTEFSTAQIQHIAGNVAGGVDQIQDVYQLSPMQEGILFHHLLAPDDDPYLIQNQAVFESREALLDFARALNAVIARHDALRASVVWEGLPDPVQVIWQNAPVEIEEVAIDPAGGDAAEQLKRLVDSPGFQIDLARAPSMRLLTAFDPETRRWILIWRSHHLFSDYATDSLIKFEIEALLNDPDARLPAPAPFKDFVATARNEVDSGVAAAFFTEMLGDVEEVTAPFGITNIQGGGAHVRDARLQLGRDLVERTKQAARRLEVGASRLFHVAWGLVVSRTSGRGDAVFGTILSGRTNDYASVLGPLINTLPIRIRLGRTGVADCVRETDRLLKGLNRHRHASLTVAQQCSGVVAPAPLFTSVFNYYRVAPTAGAPTEGAQAPSAIAFGQDYPLTNYPIMLTVEDFGEVVGLTAQTDPAVDPQRICEMMAEAVAGLVDVLERQPELAVGTIDILPADERRLILETWNETERAYDETACVHQLVERQAVGDPDRIAVTDRRGALTYRELNATANRLAHRLRALGVRPDDRIALCVQRSAEMLVALLGILKAGGAYVPVDPDFPVDRQALILDDSAASIVLVDDTTRAAVTAATEIVQGNPRIFDLSQEDWRDGPSTNLPLAAGLDAGSLCYLIYTSGSTGRPKGVMVEHGNLVNLLNWAVEEFTADELAAVIASTSLCFDIHAFECFVPLIVGGRIIVVQNGLDLDHVRDATLLNTVPSVLRVLGDTRTIPASLVAVNVAGEKLPASVVETAFATTDLPRLRNLYGPSEATVYSTFVAMDRRTGFLPHIGRPVANTTVYILDDMMNPVPIGVAGEMYIGGSGVGRGYLARPELTLERFMESPFVPGDRLYRTGDMARYLDDGSISYIGRNDFQVKIRGFRIELGEIEAAVSADPDVLEAVVIAQGSDGGDQRLVCFAAVPHGAPDVVEKRLRLRIANTLPAHMMPAAFVIVDRFPTTPNGKLDRAALPMPDSASVPSADKEGPAGFIEEAIARQWSEILMVPFIGRHDNFFDLGGHSLDVMRVIAGLKTALRYDFSIPDMFQHPTVASFAAVIASRPAYEEEVL